MEKGNNAGGKKLLNLFDIVIIAVVVVLAGVFLLWRAGKLSTQENVVHDNSTVRYAIELSNMRYDSAEMIQVGDEILDNIKNFTMGTVVAVEVRDAETLTKDYETGAYIVSTIPGAKTAVVTLESDCVESATGFVVDGGYSVCGGNSVNVVGPGYYGQGYVLYIERGE